MDRRNRGGELELGRLLHLLECIFKGCEDRVLDGRAPDLAPTAGKARAAWQTLSDALFRKKAALTEFRNAKDALDRLYFEARDAEDECRAALQGKYGFRSIELGDFGLRPREPRRRRTG